MVIMDPELEAFIPLFPPADLTDPPSARKNLAALAAAVPALDTTGMEIQDHTVAADPEVAVRIYRPTRPRAPLSGCTAADSSWATWTPSTRRRPGRRRLRRGGDLGELPPWPPNTPSRPP